jgi:hypothetical protein
MLSAKITLLSLAIPVGTWQAWISLDQSHLVIRVALAVFVSFGIFMAILRATEHTSVVTRRARTADAREPASFAMRSRAGAKAAT